MTWLSQLHPLSVTFSHFHVELIEFMPRHSSVSEY